MQDALMDALMEPAIVPATITGNPAIKPYAITKENAREFALKSIQVRREKKERLMRELEAKQACVELPPDVAEELKIVEEQIAHARRTLNCRKPFCPACEREELQPHHRAQLMKALDAFLDRRRILLGRPNPGTLKPTTPRPTKIISGPVPEPEFTPPSVT